MKKTRYYIYRGEVREAETGSEIIGVQDQMLQATCHAIEVQKKTHTHTHIANADCFSNTPRQ
jgi:hypothetical protein